MLLTSAFMLATAVLNPAQVLDEEELKLSEQTVQLDQELIEDGEFLFEEGEAVSQVDEEE